MLKWFKQLDEILRGDATRMSSLSEGEIRIPVGGLSVTVALLGVLYGLCAGSFAMIRTGGEAYMQLIAGAIKLPMLFFLTLAVTFPSLYVFNALIGTRLSVVSALRLLIAALGVMLAVLASLGPIVVFFALSTKNYPFMVLLNVATSTVAGILGLKFLLSTLDRLVVVQEGGKSSRVGPKSDGAEAGGAQNVSDTTPVSEDKPAEPTAALDVAGEFTTVKAKSVFRVWTAVFALVGAQMSWVLRPFIGSPTLPFEWFRERESNFFIAVVYALMNMFSS
ncbi:MAG: hypothetical protein ACYSW0_16890 [Planctomycetota bacterium]|jgi:hypothetical protein